MKSLQLVACLASLSLYSTARAQKPADLDSGILYETTTRGSAEGMPFASHVEKTRTIETRRGRRVEVLERTPAMGVSPIPTSVAEAPGTYRLTLDGGRRIISVDTVNHEYFEVSLGGPGGMDSSLTKMISSMKMKMSGTKSDLQELGDGGIIAGQPTTHWKVHEKIMTSTSHDGDTAEFGADTFTETWYAKDISSIEPLDTGKFDDPQLKDLPLEMVPEDSVTKAIYRRLPKTLPLKQISKGTMGMGGMMLLTTTTMEITRLERGRFDAALFEVPKGYKRSNSPFPF